jgi:hypothetical protein
VALKACTVVVHDLNDTAHAIDVTAESLYEAIAQALALVRGHDNRHRKGPESRGYAYRQDSGF